MSVTLAYASLTARDLAITLAFYRDLGLPVPEGAHLNAEGGPEDHVEVTVNGLRIAWESEALARQLNPAWTPPTGNARLGIAFQAASPAELDATCARMLARGHTVTTPALRRLLGPALRHPARPGREQRGCVCVAGG